MSSPAPRKEVSPAVAAVTIVVALLVIAGLGWMFFFRPTDGNAHDKPSQAPRLPANIPPPPVGAGPTAKSSTP